MDNDRNTINIFNQYVKEYVNRFMNLDLYKDTFDKLLELIPANANILDLGCGPGNVVKYLEAKRKDLYFLGIDLAPGMIKEAERQCPGTRFELMDIRNAGETKEKFTVIIAAFCIPYISYDDADALFKNVRDLIIDDGLFYLSFMEGTKQRSGFERTSIGNHEIYINYYEKEDIERKLLEHHFNIIASYAQDYPEGDGSITTDLIYIAKKESNG